MSGPWEASCNCNETKQDTHTTTTMRRPDMAAIVDEALRHGLVPSVSVQTA